MLTAAIRTAADVGALIRDRRRVLALDQAELAQKIGVSRLWVNQVERGKPGANLGLVLRALTALGVNLLGDIETAANTRTPRRAARIAPVRVADIDAIIARAKSKARK
jgi:HTH-type transcriptional regulator/antitoxin HipB